MTGGSRGTVEVDGRIRAEDRRPVAGDPAQRQSLLRHDVRRRHLDHEEADRPRLCPAPHAAGSRSTKSPRSRATARRTRCSRRTTSSPISRPGTKAASGPADDHGHASARVCPRGAQARAGLRGDARREPVQVRHDRLDRRPHRALDHDGGQFLRQGGDLEPSADPIRFDEVIAGRYRPRARRAMRRQTSASGLAGGLGADNTREALWDAMARKEVYATTGTRLMRARLRRLRFHRGRCRPLRLRQVRLRERACRWAATSPPRPRARPRPSDPRAAGRRRRQSRPRPGRSRAGWTRKGETHEQVCDVAWSGDRKIGADGKLPPVGNTVNVAEATYTNTIGAAELHRRSGRTRISTRRSAPSTTSA